MNVRHLSLLSLAVLAACQNAAAPADTTSPTAEPACQAAVTLSLQPGETRVLSEAEARCFSVAQGSGAEYALAGYDARAIAAERAAAASGGFGEPSYTVADRSRGGAVSRNLAARAEPSATALPGDVRMSATSSPGEPYGRTTPWREGERFSVRPMVGTSLVGARVVSVVGGRFVLAVLDSDEDGAGRVLSQAEKALEYLAAQGVPVLQAAFGEATPTPTTSAGSGQLLVLAAAWNPDQGAAATWTQETAAGAHSYVWLNTNLRPGKGTNFEMYDHTSYRVKVLGHELAHAWQVQYLRAAHRHAAHAAAAWSIEGGADFVGMDLLRRYLNVGLTANWNWQDHLDPFHSEAIYALEPAGAQGRLSWGYYDAASLLRDLQQRLMAAGLSAEAAMGEVARGAVEGWYGADGDGGCPGLVERMRGHLGTAWDPAEAVLTWTLTQAADDRTPNRALNNPVYRKVGDRGAAYGWKPAATVRAGGGSTAGFTQVSGGSFFVRVEGAGTLSATSSVEGVRWMIARTE